MTEKIWWYTARAGGLLAFALLTLAVAWGLLLSTKLLGRKPPPAWLLSLHRWLGGLAVVFTGVHILGLVADRYVYFGWSEVLIPMASSWKPGLVALGVVAFYLLIAVEITSLLMRRLPRKVWRWVHSSSYVLFWLAAIHGAAGSDAGTAAYVYFSVAAIASVLFLTLVRVLAPRRSARSRGAAPQTA